MWMGRKRVESSRRSMRRRMCASSTWEPQPSQKAMDFSPRQLGPTKHVMGRTFVQTRVFTRRCLTEIDAPVRLRKTEADARQSTLGFETVLSLVAFFVSRG